MGFADVFSSLVYATLNVHIIKDTYSFKEAHQLGEARY